MKNVDAAVRNAIRSAYDVTALPRLTAEWNMNRYYDTVVSNGIANWEAVENDVDMFPIESIVEPIRPSKGINKARINYGTVSDGYHSPAMPRFYIASLDDPYKYWISPTPSVGGGGINNVAPQVIYEKSLNVNKVVVGVENTWASPQTWSIQTTRDNGATWQTASSSPAIGADGRAVLYWNGAGWSSTRPSNLDAVTSINGVRVIVSRLTGGRGINDLPTTARTRFGMATTSGEGSYFSLIEISARLELDLSDDLLSVGDTFDGGEANQVTPVGTITSNVARLSIWNGGNDFSNRMEGLLEPNVKMNLEYLYHVGNNVYPVQQFSMFVNSWKENDDSTIEVDLSDASKYLSLLYPREAKYEKMTLAQIVYQLLDSVGFTDYNVVRYSNINDFRIPVFWVDGTQTIWEIFDELSTATQSLIYFDGYGRLNVRSREQAFDPNRPVDWTLRYKNAGDEVADIVSVDKSGQFDSNLIKVKYKQTAWAEEINGIVQNSSVWSPDETVVLRSTPLLGKIDLNDRAFLISPAEAVHWPYKGFIQIEGEFIEFSAKHFNYRENGQWKSAWVKDQKEYDEYNEKAPYDDRVNNHWSGYFLIEDRGVWNTTPASHNPDAKGWESKRYSWGHNGTHGVGVSWNNASCLQWLRGASILRLVGAGELQNEAQWSVVTRNVPSEAYYHTFGTRFRFNGAGNHKGGIVFNATGDGDGYYIELRPTNTIANKDRDSQDEITIYAIHGNNIKQMKANWRAPDLIVQDTWHDLEVTFNPNGHYINIWLDGKRVMSDSISPSNYRHAATNRFGMFIRGQTNMDFEYIYALSGDEPALADNASFLDRVRGGYVGNNWMNDRVFRMGTRRRFIKRKGKKPKRKNQKYKYTNFMDEFGPYVHEVREFDVKFDPAPVKSSQLYFSNDWQVICPEYRANSHGAYFILANASRTNAVVHGTDDFSFAAAGASVDQQMMVFGRALVIGEDEEVEARNEDQIRARGEIVADIDSPWVQDEGAAQAVADWIAKHWSRGADQIDIEVFGNPLFELGDVVAVEYPVKGMTAETHQYYITGIDTEFDAGITTSLTLQRKN